MVVDVHYVADGLVREVADAHRGADPGVRDGDVDWAELFADLCDDRRDRFCIDDIARKGDGLSAGVDDLANDLREHFFASCEQRYSRLASAGQFDGEGGSDSRACAGQQDNR